MDAIRENQLNLRLSAFYFFCVYPASDMAI